MEAVQFLEKVTLENFGVYEHQLFEFDKGLNIIAGKNGVGKSLLLDAIRLGLGLNAKSVRMDSMKEYLMNPDKEAQIILQINNPLGKENVRLLSSANQDFDSKFLGKDSVFIQRQINKKGVSTFKMKDDKGDYPVLSPTEKELLFESLANIGLDPDDPMIFISGEDWGSFLDESPKNRFNSFVEKFNITEIQTEFKSRIDEIEIKLNEKEEFNKELQKIQENLEEKKVRKDKYEEFEKLDDTIKKLEDEKQYIDYAQLETSKKSQESRDNEKSTELNQKQTELAEITNILTEYSKVTQKLDSEIKETEININNLQTKIQEIDNKINKNAENQKHLANEIKKKEIEKDSKLREVTSINAQLNDSSLKDKNEQNKEKEKRKTELIKEKTELNKEKVHLEESLDQKAIYDKKKIEAEKRLANEFLIQQTRLGAELRKNAVSKEKEKHNQIDELKTKRNQLLNNLRKVNYEKISNQIRELEDQARSESFTKISSITGEMTELKNQIRTLEDQKYELEEATSVSKGIEPSYHPNVVKAYENIQASEFKDEIFGPVGSLIELDESYEIYRDLLKSNLKQTLGAFIVTSKEAAREIESYNLKVKIIRVLDEKRIKNNYIRKSNGVRDLREEKIICLASDLIKSKDKENEDIILAPVREDLQKLVIIDEVENLSYFDKIIEENNDLLRGILATQKGRQLRILTGTYRFGGRDDQIDYSKNPKESIGDPIEISKSSKKGKDPKIDALDKQISAINKKIKELEDKISSMKNVSSLLSKDKVYSDLKKELEQLDVNLEKDPQILKLDEEIKEVSNQFDDTGSKKSSSEEDIKDKIEQIPAIMNIKKEIAELDSKLEGFEQDALIKKQITELTNKLNGKNREIDDLVRQIAEGTTDTDRKSLEIRKQQLEKDIDNLDSELVDLKKEPGGKDQPVASFNQEKTEINNQITKLNQEISQKKKEKDAKLKELGTKEGSSKLILAQISLLQKEIENLNKTMKNYEEQIKETEKTEWFKKLKKPSKIRPKSDIELDIRGTKTKLEIYNKEGISIKDKEDYEKQEKLSKDLIKSIENRTESISKLREDLIEWNDKYEDVFEEKMNSLNKIFSEVLKSVDAYGRIEILNLNRPGSEEAFIYTSFPSQEERELRKHSSGQRQIGLVALAIAMQSQSKSPITAIDEFDKGLDPINKKLLIKSIPEMLQLVSSLDTQEVPENLSNQLIAVLPEVTKESFSDDLNFITISRQNGSISITN